MSLSASSASSPLPRLSGSDIDLLSGTFDPSYTVDISNKMQVPKRIQVSMGGRGDGGDEMNGNWTTRPSEKVNMQVPDRIIVTGQEQHKGIKSLPRELQLETVVMPPEEEIIRIQTPPRSITLQNAPQRHDDSTDSYDSNEEDESLIVENNRARFEPGVRNGSSSITAMASYLGADTNFVSIPPRVKRDTRSYLKDGNEEIEHLREQLSRMNRRLLSVEEDTSERKEKERYLVMAGLFYCAYKTISWLFRSSSQN